MQTVVQRSAYHHDATGALPSREVEDMSTKTTRVGAASPALHTFIAGIIGAIGTDAFLSISNHTSPTKVWQFIASAGFGAIAFDSPVFVWIGLVMHLITALFWAYLYAYVWSRVSSLRNWLVGGIVWGIVVDVCMDAFMAFRGVLEPQTTSSVISGLITNVVFYGLLVAWYLSRGDRTTA
jgi:hypothetical protein